MNTPLIVSWGGGVNSTAMLIGMHHRQIRPDLILFADTGGEKPKTYDYITIIDTWLLSANFPSITVVRRKMTGGTGKGCGATTLEQDCLQKNMLPSLAYGYKSCSQKWKREPQDAFCKTWQPAINCWAFGGKVRKAIGIDAGEARRATITEDEKYTYEYPLLDYEAPPSRYLGWYREQCIAAIQAEGLPLPCKSACFFCPASKKREVFLLQQEHPVLFSRALAIEQGATDNLFTVKGLGRSFSWGELIAKDRLALPLFANDLDAPPVEQTCMCYDGEDD